MKKRSFRNYLLSAAVLLAVPSFSFAAKGDGPKAKALAKYDLNKDGKIDADEASVIRKDFSADTSGDLKRFDADNDGKLSDEEIASMVPGSGKKAKGGAPKEKKGKKHPESEPSAKE